MMVATLGFSAPNGGTCSFTAAGTDLTSACTPALTPGGCSLFLSDSCRRRKAQNTAALSAALTHAPPGTTLLVPPGTYHLDAGVYSPLVNGTTLLLAGTLDFGAAGLQSSRSVREHWPGFNMSDPGRSRSCNCFTIKRYVNIRFAAPHGGRGVVDGGGRSAGTATRTCTLHAGSTCTCTVGTHAAFYDLQTHWVLMRRARRCRYCMQVLMRRALYAHRMSTPCVCL